MPKTPMNDDIHIKEPTQITIERLSDFSFLNFNYKISPTEFRKQKEDVHSLHVVD